MIKKIAVAALIILGGLGVETSCTPQPQCPPGYHAERANSHQGKVWVCVKAD